jgi:hypothetical protein
MVRIQQPVGLVGCQRGRHNKDRLAPPACEAVADRGKFDGCRCLAPGGRQAAGADVHTRHIVWYVRGCHDEIGWRIVAIEMNEVLDHGQRQMLRSIREPSARARPPAAIAIRALSVERGLGVTFS